MSLQALTLEHFRLTLPQSYAGRKPRKTGEEAMVMSTKLVPSEEEGEGGVIERKRLFNMYPNIKT